MFPETVAALLVLSITGGVIAGLGGPGGMPVIIGITALTAVSPAVQAGTTSTIFSFATLFAASMYAYSGDIRKDLAVLLAAPTLIGTPIGVYFNQFMPEETFNLIIGVLAVLTGVIVTYREFNELNSIHDIDLNEKSGKITTVVIGILVGFIGGLTGIGGPALSIPILVIVGIPVLEAIGAGLVQGFFVTTSTAANYINSGKISTSLLLIMGAPYVLSQIFGWYYAQNTDTRKLKIIVSLFLALSGLYLVFV